MVTENLEIVDKKPIQDLIKELKYLNDGVLAQALAIIPEIETALKGFNTLIPALNIAKRDLDLEIRSKSLNELQKVVFERSTELEEGVKVVNSFSESLSKLNSSSQKILQEQKKVVSYAKDFDFDLLSKQLRMDIQEIRTLIRTEIKAENKTSNYLILAGLGIFLLGSVLTAILLKLIM